MLAYGFFDVVALAYYACFVSLGALTVFIAYWGRCHQHSRTRLRTTFILLALTVLSWQATLFLEVRTTLPFEQIWIGRFNFSIAAIAVYLAFRFVHHIPAAEPSAITSRSIWLLSQTGLLVAITLLTPLVDAEEHVMPGGRAITVFGPLFPLYLTHVLMYLALAVESAFRERARTHDSGLRWQLGIVGFGLLATGCVAFLTNAALPYSFNNYRYCDIGGISVLVFVLSVAYATFVHGLFDVRIIVRETLVYGLLLAFVLGAYSSAVFVISQHLTKSAGKLTQFIVLVVAFSVEPIRRYLEKRVDQLLFGRRLHSQHGMGRILALLFPWRRQ